MVEKLILLVTRELADEKHRPLVIGILLAPLFLIAVIVLLVVGAFSFFTVTLGTFLTEDTSLVGETVAVMDKAREAYVEEQMDLYRQRVDRNGKPYRNVVLQWENGFSNNDKEILTIVSCYYEQDWEIDMADLASWAVLKSISFSTRERGPYSCGGCRSRKVCDGHPDGNGGTYHHSDDAADCDNYHTVTYCPGDHYDLYVTATLPGCQTWNDEAGATEQTIARWDDLVDLSYTGSSAVMQQYQQAVRMATLNEDWEGWTELNIEWSKVLFQTDWEELYGVTVTQVGITDSGSYTPDDSFTGNLPGSGNGTFILPLASYSYISCHFGEADGWTGAPHGGMDFAAGYGTPIYAAADGVVVKAGWHNSWGNYVKIYHGTDAQGNKIYTLYAHASSLAATAGQTVTQGQTIVSPSAQDTATSISKMLGDETILTGSTSKSDGKTTSSHQLMGRPLLSPAQMVRIQRDTWIVEKAGYAPMKTHLEGYWKYLSLAPQEQDAAGENDYLEIKLLSTESLRQALGSASTRPHTPPAATREPRRKLGASRREAAALYPGKFNP